MKHIKKLIGILFLLGILILPNFSFAQFNSQGSYSPLAIFGDTMKSKNGSWNLELPSGDLIVGDDIFLGDDMRMTSTGGQIFLNPFVDGVNDNANIGGNGDGERAGIGGADGTAMVLWGSDNWKFQPGKNIYIEDFSSAGIVKNTSDGLLISEATVDDDELTGVYIYADGSRELTADWGLGNSYTISEVKLPVNATDVASKEYVDNAINFIAEYYYNDTASDIGGIYFDMVDTPSGEGESTFTTAGLGTGDDQALTNFANVSGVPGLTMLESGIYSGHIHAEKTAGTKPVKIYFEIYIRELDTTETLIATSEESEFIINKGEFEVHATLSSDIIINTTDRIIIKWLANVEATGSAATIVLYAEGTTSSRLAVPISTDVLNNVFVRQDGTKDLTGNWTISNNNITLTNGDLTAANLIARNILAVDEDLIFADSGTHRITMSADDVTSADSLLTLIKNTDGSQPRILSQCRRTPDSNMCLNTGVHYINEYGFIQAREDGVENKILAINPLGGNVGIGKVDPNFTLDVDGQIYLETALNINAVTQPSIGWYVDGDESAGLSYNNTTGLQFDGVNPDMHVFGALSASSLITIGGNIGIVADTDLIQLTNGEVVINGNLTLDNTSSSINVGNLIDGDGQIVIRAFNLNALLVTTGPDDDVEVFKVNTDGRIINFNGGYGSSGAEIDSNGSLFMNGNLVVDGFASAKSMYIGTSPSNPGNDNLQVRERLILNSTRSFTTPPLTFDGDLNTGLSHPSADKLIFSTNGQASLYLSGTDGTGRLGVHKDPTGIATFVAEQGNDQTDPIFTFGRLTGAFTGGKENYFVMSHDGALVLDPFVQDDGDVQFLIDIDSASGYTSGAPTTALEVNLNNDDVTGATNTAFKSSVVGGTNSTNWAGYFADGWVKIENNLVVDNEIILTNGAEFTRGTFVKSVTINYNSGSPTTILAVDDGYAITDVYAEVTTVWNGNGTVNIGDEDDADGFLENAGLDKGTTGWKGNTNLAGSAGNYLRDFVDFFDVPKKKIYSSSKTIRATVVTGTSTQGSMTIYVVSQKLK